MCRIIDYTPIGSPPNPFAHAIRTPPPPTIRPIACHINIRTSLTLITPAHLYRNYNTKGKFIVFYAIYGVCIRVHIVDDRIKHHKHTHVHERTRYLRAERSTDTHPNGFLNKDVRCPVPIRRTN